MTRFNVFLAFAAFAAGALLTATYASAQATRTWVSGVGDDANPCSRTAPCKTFAGAISKTATGGEINCLDPAGFGAVTITKSMTIDCTGTFGSILSSSTNGVIVNGANAAVTLRGLSINGSPSTSPGINGVRFLQGETLIIEDAIIQSFTAGGSGNGNGVMISPSSGNVSVVINDTKIFRNGATNVGHGILFLPTGATNISALIKNSSIDNNDLGINVANSGSGSIRIAITNTSMSNNDRHGINASGNTSVNILDSTIANNNIGLQAVSPAAIRVGSSMIAGNAIGVGGDVQSFGNNQLIGNTVPGSPASVPPG
ncbi:right-handed parallel beta-helix repeat-containing protein [Mesorhizobium sp. NPDC059025]|uniref:right-handed parallel beta-helix repeat-containing protein n=1 Tax=unclassified Mesorhizobium TaxID=325217 RepID=UPI00367279D8